MNNFLQKLLSPISCEIWKMLDNPKDWRIPDEYSSKGKPFTIHHEKTKISLWISNGRWFLNGWKEHIFEYNEEGRAVKTLYRSKAPRIGLFDRHILWFKVKKVLNTIDYQDALLTELRDFNNDE